MYVNETARKVVIRCEDAESASKRRLLMGNIPNLGLNRLYKMGKSAASFGSSKKSIYQIDMDCEKGLNRFIFYKHLQDGKKQLGVEVNTSLAFNDTNLTTVLVQ